MSVGHPTKLLGRGQKIDDVERFNIKLLMFAQANIHKSLFFLVLFESKVSQH